MIYLALHLNFSLNICLCHFVFVEYKIFKLILSDIQIWNFYPIYHHWHKEKLILRKVKVNLFSYYKAEKFVYWENLWNYWMNKYIYNQYNYLQRDAGVENIKCKNQSFIHACFKYIFSEQCGKKQVPVLLLLFKWH